MTDYMNGLSRKSNRDIKYEKSWKNEDSPVPCLTMLHLIIFFCHYMTGLCMTYLHIPWILVS